MFLQAHSATSQFSDFKSQIAIWFENTRQLVKYAGHRKPPFLNLSKDRKAHRRRIDSTEPAAQPVVAGVIDYVEERR